jgi:uncharacterized repeat protein (TIGR01451 family)
MAAKSHSGTFATGGSGSFTVLVTNVGASTANGTVTVTDALPVGMTPVSASGTGWNTCTFGGSGGRTVTCTHSNPGGLPANTSLSPITINVNISASAGTLNNTANLSFTGDQYSANDSSTDTVAVKNSADLSVTKTSPQTHYQRGDALTYTVQVTNNGPSNATNARLTDDLPANLVYGSHTAGQGSYDPATGIWTIGALTNGASATLTINATIGGSAPYGSGIVNTAGSLTSDEVDPNQNNNSASQTVYVLYPTAVDLASFEAAQTMVGKVTVKWATLLETDIAGFNLYRGNPSGLDWVRVNDALIPAQNLGIGGSQYVFVDMGAAGGVRAIYRLDFVNPNGAVIGSSQVNFVPAVFLFAPLGSRP